MADPVVIKYPVSHTGPDGDNSTFEPVCNCPKDWPQMVMGFDLCGGTPTQPSGVDYVRKAEGKPEDQPGDSLG